MQRACRGRRLALDLAFGTARQPLVHPVDNIGKQRPTTLHVVGQVMVEMVFDRIFHQARGLWRRQSVLGLRLKLRVANEHRQHDLTRRDHVFGLNVGGFLVPRQHAECADALYDRGAYAGLVCAAIRCWNRVAIPAEASLAP